MIQKVARGQSKCCWCGHSLVGQTIVGAGDGSRDGTDGAFAHQNCCVIGQDLEEARDQVRIVEEELQRAADGWKPAFPTPESPAVPEDPGQTLFD